MTETTSEQKGIETPCSSLELGWEQEREFSVIGSVVVEIPGPDPCTRHQIPDSCVLRQKRPVPASHRCPNLPLGASNAAPAAISPVKLGGPGSTSRSLSPRQQDDKIDVPILLCLASITNPVILTSTFCELNPMLLKPPTYA